VKTPGFSGMRAGVLALNDAAGNQRRRVRFIEDTTAPTLARHV
jgi:hypothetical protein